MWFERKLAMPPAAQAPQFSEHYDQSQHDPEAAAAKRSKYYTRGYDWETIPENIARLHSLSNFPLQHPIRLDTLNRENEAHINGNNDEYWSDTWDQAPAGWHNTSMEHGGLHHAIGLHPLMTAPQINNTLWHELQHAYQWEEGRIPLDETGYQLPSLPMTDPGYDDQEHERDANDMALHMDNYPLVRPAKPMVNPDWFDHETHLNGEWDPEREIFELPEDKMHKAIADFRQPR